MKTTVITPNALRTLRRQLKESRQWGIAAIVEIRKLQADHREYFNTELAQEALIPLSNARDDMRSIIRKIRESTIEKYAAYSPTVAARLGRWHGAT